MSNEKCCNEQVFVKQLKKVKGTVMHYLPVISETRVILSF